MARDERSQSSNNVLQHEKMVHGPDNSTRQTDERRRGVLRPHTFPQEDAHRRFGHVRAVDFTLFPISRPQA